MDSEKNIISENRYNIIIRRAKRAPHCGVQSRFRVIYMYVFDCLWENNTKKLYAKMRGWNYILQTRACSKMCFGSLKRSADYNFRLEFLILPSSGRLKPTCDILRFILLYARAALSWSKKKPKKTIT